MSQGLLDRAVTLLREGRLVAFPTETVYGLGADATNAAAVARIFAAKGRPSTNPLIVHVAGVEQALRYAATWPVAAQRLAEKFWPGPLTIVVPRKELIVPEVSAGLDTVGLRCPRHPLAMELLRRFDGPVAAPSANRSNHVSPTTADHVRQDLGDAVDLVLDGGPCDVGIESTVLSLCTPEPTVLRPGNVSVEQLRKVLGKVQVKSQVVAQTTASASPGQHAIHYSPHTPCYRYTPERIEVVRAYLAEHHDDEAILICLSHFVPDSGHHHVVRMPSNADAYARHLYSALHAADRRGASVILVELPPLESHWLAVHDRLQRAARPI